MPASLATLLTLVFVVLLFVWDGRRHKDVSAALWLPVLWIVVAGSRFPSQWLNLGNRAAISNISDGSPLDAIYFSLLILVGAIVLARRQTRPSDLLRQNFWLFALVIYGLISIFWSDFPLVAAKRWIKALGHPVMALIILTDFRPLDAFRIVMRRSAFFLLPVSILFIKYLPQYGRGFDIWTGQGVSNGVMLTKNDLGYVCMLLGIFFVWNLLSRNRIEDRRARRNETLLSVGFLLMIVWLLGVANSATSLATIGVGILTLIGLGTPFVSRRYLGVYVIILATAVVSLEAIFHVYDNVVEMFGRDPTLTDRTELWADALALQTSPILGAGFESFWLGERLQTMAAKWWWLPNQAHNGYIEIYLNLGIVGLGLFTGVVVSTFRKISARLTSDFDFSRLRLALFLAILAHNYTEATFKGVHLMWTVFYLIALDAPHRSTGKERPESVRYRMLDMRRAARENSAIGSTMVTSDPATPYRSRMR